MMLYRLLLLKSSIKSLTFAKQLIFMSQNPILASIFSIYVLKIINLVRISIN